MLIRRMTCFLGLLVAGCAASESGQREPSSAVPRHRPTAAPGPAVVVENEAPLRRVMPSATTLPVSPHPGFPGDWRVRVLEPLEAQVGPEFFMSAPPAQVLITGVRQSQWPIYGAITPRPGNP